MSMLGDLVRIKEIPGTKLASKRKPLWGKVIWAGTPYDHRGKEYQNLTVWIFGEKCGRRPIHRDCILDVPPEDKVPDWVWAEIAKQALLA